VEDTLKIETILELFAYTEWANRRLLASAAALSPEALRTPVDLSFKTVWGTLLHMADCEWGWLRICRGEDAAPWLWDVVALPDLAALAVWWEAEAISRLAYLQTLSPSLLEAPLPSSAGGETRSLTLEQALLHVVNHATHHRSEIGRALAAAGHDPGDMDFTVYLRSER
jgi:uncharacterized damage-inducible protein DinB